MKANIFRWYSELNFIYKRTGGLSVIHTIILGIAFILTTVQILQAQDEFPKQAGLHSQKGIDLIPEPQIVRNTGGDFLVNSATVVYVDPQLHDLFPVTSLQEGLAEVLQVQVRKTDSQPAANAIALRLVTESGLREIPMNNYELCPLKKGTFPLVQDILDELMEVIQPAKYVHIGGDEAYEMGMGQECREKWGDKAAVESFKLWLNFVCDYLKKHGRTAIVWDDMFLRHFSQSDMTQLPDNLIYMRWAYCTGKFDAKGRKILDLGYPVWIATASQTMTPIFPDQKLRVYNNANFIPSAAALGIKGVLNTAWEDAGVHPETYWIGFVCSAEYSWSSKKPATEEFMSKFFPLFYGRDQQELDKVYNLLSEKGFIRAENSWTKEFAALDLPSLPDNEFRVDSAWSVKHSKLVAKAREMRPKYAEAVEIITKNLSGDTKNKYNLEVLLLCARTVLHFTDLILCINEINENLLAADAEHRKGEEPSAINRYQRIGRIIDDLRYDKSALFDETVRIWEKSTFPKDFRDIPGGREKFVHQIDLGNYYGNKTMDLSYIFEVEEQLGLFAYQQKLYHLTAAILRGRK